MIKKVVNVLLAIVTWLPGLFTCWRLRTAHVYRLVTRTMVKAMGSISNRKPPCVPTHSDRLSADIAVTRASALGMLEYIS